MWPLAGSLPSASALHVHPCHTWPSLGCWSQGLGGHSRGPHRTRERHLLPREAEPSASHFYPPAKRLRPPPPAGPPFKADAVTQAHGAPAPAVAPECPPGLQTAPPLALLSTAAQVPIPVTTPQTPGLGFSLNLTRDHAQLTLLSGHFLPHPSLQAWATGCPPTSPEPLRGHTLHASGGPTPTASAQSRTGRGQALRSLVPGGPWLPLRLPPHLPVGFPATST